jgi:transcriptional regulator with XRE-family HTH domain
MGKRRSKTYRGLAKPGPIDVHIGARIRLRRRQLGMAQASLGEAIGVRFQQVQNYERGKVRISAARLYYMARALDAPVAFFFDDAPDVIATGAPAGKKGQAAKAGPDLPDLDELVKPESLQLLRGYYEIDDARVRRKLLSLVDALGAASSGRAV